MDTKERLLLVSADERLQHLVEAEAWQLGIRVRSMSAASVLSDLSGSPVRMIVWDADTVDLSRDAWALLPKEIPLYLLCHPDRTPEGLEEQADVFVWQRPLSVSVLHREMMRTILGTQSPHAAEGERVLRMDWEADGRTLRMGEERYPLTEKEACIMALLLRRRGATVTREELREAISAVGDEQENTSNKVEVYLCHLRRKLEQPTGMRLFVTVRGKGYRLEMGF